MRYAKIFTAALAFSCVAMTTAQAREPGVLPAFPPGNSLGAPVGAQLPPGLYFSSRTGTGTVEGTDADGNKTGTEISVTDSAAQFLVVPGSIFLGGQYRAMATIPFSNVEVTNAPTPFGLASGSNRGMPSLDIRPVNLSWQISPGIFTSAGFIINTPGDWDPARIANNGQNFWSYGAEVGFSYMRDGWNATAHLQYLTNSANRDNDYKSGDELSLNVTAMKAIGDGSWSLGPVAYLKHQITDDSNPGGAYGGLVNGRSKQGGVGLSVSKRFGATEINAIYTQDLYSENAAEGNRLWLNVTMPLTKPKMR